MTTHGDKEWLRLLGHVPTRLRPVAEQFPPGSRWQLLDDDQTYYTPVGLRGDGRLVMTRHLATGLPVQRHDGVDPKDLIPWTPGRAN